MYWSVEHCEQGLQRVKSAVLLPLQARSSLSMKYSGPQSDLQVLQNSELYIDFPVHMDAVSTYVPDETSLQH